MYIYECNNCARNKLLADGILQSRYFEDLKNSWKDLDIVVVGIGDFSNKGKHQWLDMLTEDDFKELTKVKTVGEICCRFFDSKVKKFMRTYRKER